MKNRSAETLTAAATSSFSTEEALTLILNNIEDSVFFIDRNLHVVATNEQTKSKANLYFGVKLTIGMSILEMAPPERHSSLASLYQEVFNGAEKTSEVEITNQGAVHYIQNVFKPAINGSGQIIGAIVHSRDITISRKEETALREIEERWRFALEGSNQGVWDWNLRTNEVIYSSSYKKMYGFEENELKNNLDEWQSRIHPEDRRVIDDAVEKHIGSSNPFYESVYRIKGKDQNYKWILARGMLIGKDERSKPLRMIGTHTDITDRVNAEENYKLLFYNNPLPMWTYDVKTLRFMDVNNAAIRHYGYSREEFLAMTIKDIRSDEEVKKLLELMNEGEKPYLSHGTWRHIKKNGEKIFVEISTYKFERENDQRVLVLANDITERIRAQDQLIRSNERFDIIMKATHDLIWDWNLETGIIYREGLGLKNVYGVNDNESIKTLKQWIYHIHPEDFERVEQVISEILRSEKQDTFELEYRFRKEDGTYAFVYDRGMIMRGAAGKPIRMIGAAQDITDRKRLEQEILQNELERQKAINQATVDTQEQERGEIGKELHDNVNQVLTTTKLYLDLALTNFDLKDELIKKSSKNIIGVINEIRQLSRSLMDPSIGDLGLVASLNDLIENINLTRKLHVSMCAEKEIEHLMDKNQKLTVFRIIQEALNNAIRHARAATVGITFAQYDNHIQINIQDDGIGFQPGSVKKGAGLKNIQNRIYLINGTHTILSSPDKGCKIIINFPITK